MQNETFIFSKHLVSRRIINIPWIILIHAIFVLSGEISADISSLSVDTTTDTSEQSNGGATKTITGEGFVQGSGGAVEPGVEIAVEPVDEEEQIQDTEGDESLKNKCKMGNVVYYYW